MITADNAFLIANKIWKYLNKEFGYQPFGIDWRTLRLLYPRIAGILGECYSHLNRPE